MSHIIYMTHIISQIHLHRHVHHFVRDRHHDHVIDCEIDHDRDHHLGVSVICSDLLRETLRDWNFDIKRDQMSGNRDICLCNPEIKKCQPGKSFRGYICVFSTFDNSNLTRSPQSFVSSKSLIASSASYLSSNSIKPENYWVNITCK